MKLTPEQRRIARAILEHPDDSFVTLTRVAGLDPATAWIGADLRGVVCNDDVAAYVFHRADLRGADFTRARGMTSDMFKDAIVDSSTRGLPAPQPGSPTQSFDPDRVRKLLYAGEAVPSSWVPYVTNLNLAWAQLSNFSPLAELTALQTLDLSHASIADLSPLSKLTNLRSLNLSFTEVRDISPLFGLIALQSLDLARTSVRDLSPLIGLTGLRGLSVWGTRVNNLQPLSGLTALQSLDLSRTWVNDLGPLSALTSLEDLDLSVTDVSDVRPLAPLLKLRRLDLLQTRVRDTTAVRRVRVLKVDSSIGWLRALTA